jgi:hypothetical protein
MFARAIELLLEEERRFEEALPSPDNDHNTGEMRANMCRVIVELRLARSYLQGKVDSQGKLNRILSEIAEIRKVLNPMSNLSTSVSALLAEVADVRTKDVAILAAIKGQNTLVADAVAKAIADSNGDAAAAVTAIQGAVNDLKIDPDAMLAAINANTNPPADAPPPAPPAPVVPPTDPTA